MTVAAFWGAVYDVGRWVYLFALNPVHIDFSLFYVAAQAGLRHGWGALYDVNTLRSLSASLPEGERYTFVFPPILAWLIAPLTLLPLPAAFLVWTLASVAALGWVWYTCAPYRGLAKVALLLAALAVWPVLDSFYYGQPLMIVLGLVALAWWLCLHERPLAAGAALAVATALKPQVVILVPAALLVSGRYRPFIGWAASCGVLAAVFLAALGESGVTGWWQALQYGRSDPGQSFFTLARIFGFGPLTLGLEALLGIAALAIAWRSRGDLQIVFAVGLLGSLVSGFHLRQSDYATLVLAAWLVLRTSPPLWHRLWLLGGVATLQAITLGEPIPQLVWDAGWLLILGVSTRGDSPLSDVHSQSRKGDLVALQGERSSSQARA